VFFHFPGIEVHTLKVGDKIKPGFQKSIVVHEDECNWIMSQDVVKIGSQRPIRMPSHDIMITSDNIMSIGEGIL
jgi:hypothetical protein